MTGGARHHDGAPGAASTLPAPRYRRDPQWSHDAPRYCPACGRGLDGPGSLAVEYWEGDDRTFHTRCGECGWSGDITKIERMIGHEAPHD